MKWTSLRNLVWTPPEKRWNADLFFIPATVYVTIRLIRGENRLVLGIVVGVSLLVLREVLYHYLVRRKRPSDRDAA